MSLYSLLFDTPTHFVGGGTPRRFIPTKWGLDPLGVIVKGIFCQRGPLCLSLYWVLSGVDVLRKDANLIAKPRGEKTHRQRMLDHVWKKRIDSGYLFLGDWHDCGIPGEKRQTAIDQKNGWKLTVSETEEVAFMDAWGDPIYATEEEIAAAKLLPFNQRLYNMPRKTVGPDSYDEGQDVQIVSDYSSAADQP